MGKRFALHKHHAKENNILFGEFLFHEKYQYDLSRWDQKGILELTLHETWFVKFEYIEQIGQK